MGSVKQRKRSSQQRERLQRHKRSVVCISAVILLLVAVISVSSISLQAKNKSYIAKEQELAEQIEAEKARAEEMAELESYVGTSEYVEDVAKDKLGMAYENEIIFKAR